MKKDRLYMTCLFHVWPKRSVPRTQGSSSPLCFDQCRADGEKAYNVL